MLSLSKYDGMDLPDPTYGLDSGPLIAAAIIQREEGRSMNDSTVGRD